MREFVSDAAKPLFKTCGCHATRAESLPIIEAAEPSLNWLDCERCYFRSWRRTNRCICGSFKIVVHDSVPPGFYPFPDIRWAIPQADASGFAGREKSHNFPIHKPHLFQVQRCLHNLCFAREEFLQFRHVLFLDSATQTEDCEPVIFGSSNLQHSLAWSSNIGSIMKH